MGTNERRKRSNKKQLWFLVILLLALPFALNALVPEKGINVHFKRPDGSVTEDLWVEIAKTPEQRAMGLMHRKEMGDNAGMIFIYPGESNNTFWMKNTPLSLDMIFMDGERKVVGIVDNTVPFSLKARGVDEPSQYVLELNAGRAKALNISKGAQLVAGQPLPKAIK